MLEAALELAPPGAAGDCREVAVLARRWTVAALGGAAADASTSDRLARAAGELVVSEAKRDFAGALNEGDAELLARCFDARAEAARQPAEALLAVVLPTARSLGGRLSQLARRAREDEGGGGEDQRAAMVEILSLGLRLARGISAVACTLQA